MKKFIEEFKTFALRGNMMDMAVGVIIGGAFSNLVTSLTNNFIYPILNFFTGGEIYTLKDIAGFFSSFISSLVNFLIMAFVLFCLLKVINKLTSLGHKQRLPLLKQKPVLSAKAKLQPMPHAVLTALPCWLQKLLRFQLKPLPEF